MRGVYKANIKIAALATTKTVLLLTVPTNKVVELISARITNSSNATNQQLEATWAKVNVLGTPAGTTLTPSKTEQGDQAAVSTVLGNLTAEPTSYLANTAYGDMGFPSLTGYLFEPLDAEKQYFAGADVWGLRLLTATFSAQDTIVEVSFREIG